MHADLTALRDALTREEVQYAVLEVRGDRARVTPVVSPGALFLHLTARFAEAWSLAWSVENATPSAVRCRLELLGSAREGLGIAGDLEQARALALTEAARAWTVLPAAYDAGDAWVEYDPDEGPNTSELLHDSDSGERPAANLPPEPPRDPQMEKARKHIDELLDQLRERNLGKQASLVLVRHHGYGETLEESRRVYAELKALMKDHA